MDAYLFNLLNQFAGKWDILDVVGIFFAKYSGYVLAIAVIFIFYKHWRIISQVFLTAVVSRFAVAEIIRFFWHRSRPFIENNINLIFPHDNTGSFPSGHAAFYFALTTIVYFYNKKIGILFFAVSFLMGVARVFVGVHWPSDILAGALIRIVSSGLVIKVSKKISKKA